MKIWLPEKGILIKYLVISNTVINIWSDPLGEAPLTYLFKLIKLPNLQAERTLTKNSVQFGAWLIPAQLSLSAEEPPPKVQLRHHSEHRIDPFRPFRRLHLGCLQCLQCLQCLRSLRSLRSLQPSAPAQDTATRT